MHYIINLTFGANELGTADLVKLYHVVVVVPLLPCVVVCTRRVILGTLAFTCALPGRCQAASVADAPQSAVTQVHIPKLPMECLTVRVIAYNNS